MNNMYQQIVDKELYELKEKLNYLTNSLNSSYTILSELWVYHPANPDFINPIKAYDELKSDAVEIESYIKDLENKIEYLEVVS
jgi:hypothetical protein